MEVQSNTAAQVANQDLVPAAVHLLLHPSRLSATMAPVEEPPVAPARDRSLATAAHKQDSVEAQSNTAAQGANLASAAARELHQPLPLHLVLPVWSSATMPPVEEPPIAPVRDRPLATAAHKQDSVEAQSNTAAQGANLASAAAPVLLVPKLAQLKTLRSRSPALRRRVRQESRDGL